MVSFKFLTVALAGLVSAIDFSDWAQHNGLVSHYNQFYKENTALQNMVSTMGDNGGEYTFFLPTDNAWGRWQSHKNYSQESFAASTQTFMYMVVKGRYTINELTTMNGDSLTTMLQGEKVQVQTSGIEPHLTAAILSGSDHTIKSVAGQYQDDFQCDQGMIQLVDTVFQLPDAIFTKANKNTAQAPSSAPSVKIPVSAISMLSAGVALTTITSFLF